MTTDVIMGQSKNGTIITQCLPTGYYSTNDCVNCHPTAKSGLVDTVIEAQYTDKFDENTYYTA